MPQTWHLLGTGKTVGVPKEGSKLALVVLIAETLEGARQALAKQKAGIKLQRPPQDPSRN